MGKVLITAEKPDMAKMIAQVLGVPTKNEGGYFEDNSYIVTYAFGHLIRWKKPDEIDEKYKMWSLDPLPFKFDIYKDLTVDEEKKKQYSVIRKLINRADVDYIVNAGDADREGLLIQEEIYRFAGNKKPVKVLWCQSKEEAELLRCMSHLKDRNLFANMLEEAKARSTVDYMFGISYTRALAKTVANDNKVSYGRCQTPLLKLLADREEEIINFKSKDFYTIKADFTNNSNDTYSGVLIKEDGNIAKYENELDAKRVISALSGPGKVVSVKEELKKEKAPLLFSLVELQKYMNLKYKFSPKYTSDIAQKLYEKGLTTYPRTDTQYINEDIYQDIDKYLVAACSLLKIDKNKINSTDGIKRCVKNSEVTGHHAIITTGKVAKKEDIEKLEKDELLVYIVVAKRLIALLLADFEYLSMVVITEVNNKKFLSRGTRVVKNGYKTLYKNDAENEDKEDDSDEKDEIDIPKLNENDLVKAKITEKADKTKPLPRYTGYSLTNLMESKHIGRPATMAGIIEELVNKKYIELEKNKYKVTKFGMDFIKVVPEELKDPGIEEKFEEKLLAIEEGKLTYDEFIEETYKNQVEEINKLKTLASTSTIMSKVEYKCPLCKGTLKDMKFSLNCECGFKLTKEVASKKLSEANINDLLINGKTAKIKGFTSAKKTKFDAVLAIDKEKKGIKFVFDTKKKKKK